MVSAIVAEAKNRNAGGWFLVGLFFSLLGLIGIAGMPARTKEEVEREKIETAPIGAVPGFICVVLVVGALLAVFLTAGNPDIPTPADGLGCGWWAGAEGC